MRDAWKGKCPMQGNADTHCKACQKRDAMQEICAKEGMSNARRKVGRMRETSQGRCATKAGRMRDKGRAFARG
jgi:hypothetical protein